ncbi:MAG: hypothetical protein BA874_01780 [Desulfuromonadales bacterium C00003068]|jgi:hypothetical protein|nr:MAG: hypothetical protein BA874_01780 [Desulfuromonadales bacterium C00003068]
MHNSGLTKNKRIVLYLVGALLVLAVGVGVFFFYVPSSEATKSSLQWEQREVEFWQIQTFDRRFWHKDAKKYCQQLELSNHYDWRLPTLPELESLLEISGGRRKNTARVERAIYWTSTPFDGDRRRYWALSFLSDQSAAMEVHNYNDVVCVRTINKKVL